MKQFKQLVMCAVTVFAFCLAFANVVTVEAASKEKVAGAVYVDPFQDAKGNWKNTTKKRMEVDDISSIDIEFANGDRLANVKSSKSKYLEIAQTYSTSYGRATVTLHANKTGTYTVSFDVLNQSGAKRGTYKVKVQVVNNDDLIKKATFGKQVVVGHSSKMKKGTLTETDTYNRKVKGTSGKLKITPNSQYKITGMVVVSVGKNGKYSYKKIKNNRKINLSKAYENKETYASGSYSRSSAKWTYICISYKDKFFGNSVTYSVTSKRGRKEVKCVRKYGQTGKVSTSYSKAPSDLTLWQY